MSTTGPSRLVIVGDSLFADIAYEYFTHDSDYEVVAFAVESAYLKRDTLNGLPVVPFETLEDAYPPGEHSVHVAVTYLHLNRVRERLADQAKARGYALASYISSHAFVWRNVEVGEHCFIFENNVVQPFVTLGRGLVLWSGNHIGHHATIRDWTFVSSHVVISGSVDIGDHCFLGVNSTFVNDIALGADSWIGPHVTVTRSLPERSFWAPARSREREEDALEKFGPPS